MMKVYYLSGFNNGLKSILNSDTLWGNICWAIRFLYGENGLVQFLESYRNGNPQVILSSAFPYYVKEQTVFRFYPRPFLPLPSYENVSKEIQNKSIQQKIKDLSERKQKKDIAFVEEKNFFKLIHGTLTWGNFTPEPSPKYFNHLLTHNTIDRLRGTSLMIDGTGQLFMEDEFYVSVPDNNIAESGLFFLAYDQSGGVLDSALRLLSVIGIGGNRSTGKGIFRFRSENFHLDTFSEKANAMINLSLYLPVTDELNHFKSNPKLFNYELIPRTGFYAFPKKYPPFKPPLFYFREGSLFPFLNQKFYGRNQIEKPVPELSIHRYGFAFMLPAYIDEQII